MGVVEWGGGGGGGGKRTPGTGVADEEVVAVFFGGELGVWVAGDVVAEGGLEVLDGFGGVFRLEWGSRVLGLGGYFYGGGTSLRLNSPVFLSAQSVMFAFCCSVCG